MRVIELDGSRWASVNDLYDDLLPALGAPDWHGRNDNALMDSIGTGQINAIEPPYLLKIAGAKTMDPAVLGFVRDLRADLAERIQEAVDNGDEPRDVQVVLDGDF